MDVTKLSLTELKALAFDNLQQFLMYQNNQRIIDGELNKRVEEEKENKEEVKEVLES